MNQLLLRCSLQSSWHFFIFSYHTLMLSFLDMNWLTAEKSSISVLKGSLLGLCCSDKHHDQTQPEDERIQSSLQLEFLMKGRNLRQKLKKLWRNSAYWLVPPGLVSFPYNTQDHMPRDSIAKMGWAIPTNIKQENAPTGLPVSQRFSICGSDLGQNSVSKNIYTTIHKSGKITLTKQQRKQFYDRGHFIIGFLFPNNMFLCCLSKPDQAEFTKYNNRLI